ncbi:trans-enoyl-CoA isomerase-like protein [Emericellopsis cladophorae]|uniref:Trans-enoyl-CoA isomerase-like protein n=1 Tax=Emericellopsis cladophorae TaxID=2686198 RepID=A0A9Q0BBM6_9HYPO|nr:trans-enoyl-CoA isomerase-like protein [Emericellopsis cladophorae]KAI6778821.1 trans-enoyl-CoA isomerase-like protein [Emericellopsis cladophorae]
MSSSNKVINVEYRGRVAIITIANESKLNALSQPDYYELAQSLREIATHNEVFITVILAKGRFFSAGADVSITRAAPSADNPDMHKHWLQSFVAFNLNICHAFSTHPKILVIGLNGPVIGLSAALTAFADFIYAAPSTFLLTPFSSLGLVAEGGASRALVQRLGPARANEALIMSKRITAPELVQCGYVNKIFETGNGEDAKFRELVLQEVDDRLGEHLIGSSLIGIKALIRRPELDVIDAQNVKEVFAGLDRFTSGVPQEEFRKIASGEKRHKL